MASGCNTISLQELESAGVKPRKLLLNGEPGSGKSYVIVTICEISSIMTLGHVVQHPIMGLLQ